MKSLQNYIDKYKEIANSLNISGDSAELLIQLLANASYISEVENIAYTQEASLERAIQINSKIQHCIELMYSVFRGYCPRLIMNIRPLKPITFNKFDEIISSNNFKVFYLGYYEDNNENSDIENYNSKIEYSSLTLNPGEKTYKIIGLLTKEVYTNEVVVKDTNKYFIDFLEEDLSNDMEIKISSETVNVTRQLSEHILNEDSGKYVFDLTLTDFGSRIYLPSNINPNSKVSVKYFKLSNLNSYNSSELKRISIKGVELVSFKESEEDLKWLEKRNFLPEDEINDGIITIKEVPHDDLLSIHYKANRDRYINTIFRSNADIGSLLKLNKPELVKDVNIIHDSSVTGNSIVLYYIPIKEDTLLSVDEINEFKKNNGAYYITTEDLSIYPGVKYNITFDIVVELYESSDNETKENIISILNNYNKMFNINFIIDSSNPLLLNNSVYLDIQAQISKLGNVKRIKSFNLTYSDQNNNIFFENIADDFWNTMLLDLISGKAYYSISNNIKTVI